MTDGQGRTVDFKNTVVIMTSNLGSHLIQDIVGADQAVLRDRVMELLRQSFRPEFLNRLDEIIVCHALSKEHIKRIVQLQVEMLAQRLEERAKIHLQMTEPAQEFLADIGFDPVYGARPLKRVIQQRIENPLALALLERQFVEGDTVQVDLRGDEIVFEKVGSAQQEAKAAEYVARHWTAGVFW